MDVLQLDSQCFDAGGWVECAILYTTELPITEVPVGGTKVILSETRPS